MRRRGDFARGKRIPESLRRWTWPKGMSACEAAKDYREWQERLLQFCKERPEYRWDYGQIVWPDAPFCMDDL